MVHDFNDFGILKWECDEPRQSVDFLDLTITIVNGRIVTKTYQKKNNPYLYIPPHSAHPAGVASGWIFGILRTYWHQNSKYSDFVHFAKLLFKRHVMQGWDQAVLRDLFLSALNKLKCLLEAPLPANVNVTPTPPSQEEEANIIQPPVENPKLQFLHMQFHPGDIPRKEIRKIYNNTCADTLGELVGIEKFIVAYSKPKTIGGVVAKPQSFEAPGNEVSKYL